MGERRCPGATLGGPRPRLARSPLLAGDKGMGSRLANGGAEGAHYLIRRRGHWLQASSGRERGASSRDPGGGCRGQPRRILWEGGRGGEGRGSEGGVQEMGNLQYLRGCEGVFGRVSPLLPIPQLHAAPYSVLYLSHEGPLAWASWWGRGRGGKSRRGMRGSPSRREISSSLPKGSFNTLPPRPPPPCTHTHIVPRRHGQTHPPPLRTHLLLWNCPRPQHSSHRIPGSAHGPWTSSEHPQVVGGRAPCLRASVSPV